MVPVHNGQKVVFVGDSITAFGWMTVAGGLVDQINALLPVRHLQFNAVASGAVATVSGARSTAGTVPVPKAPIVVVIALKASCDSFSGTTWIDFYTPFYLYESINNLPGPPGASSGVLLIDDRHPNPTGQLLMGNWSIGSFQVLP